MPQRRQCDISPKDTGHSLALETCRTVVIGLDSVGRQIALQLASFGVSRLLLVDHRTVSRSRQTAEGYDANDVGRLKVHAVAQACHEINPMLEIQPRSSRSCPGLDLGDAVFGGMDDKQACLRLRQCDLQTASVFVLWYVSELRIEVSTLCGLAAIRKRLTGIPSDRTGLVRPPRSSVPLHVASIAAGLAVDQFVRFANDQIRSQTFLLDLATLQLKTRLKR